MLPPCTRILGVAIFGLVACGSDDGDGAGGASTADGSTATTSAATGSATSATTRDDGPTSAADGASTPPGDTSPDDEGSTGSAASDCDDPRLVWHGANKTNYESYPDPGSPECVEFNGCTWAGQFAACENTMPERWVMAHDIVAVFPLGDLAMHRLCLRSGDTTLVVTVLDTCADRDCDGCCTENLGDAEALIDVEKYTNERFGVEDGPIEWADLGPGDPSFDGCN